MILAGISVVYSLGKFLGPNPLAKQSGYLLELTAHRYFVNNRWYLNDIFYTRYFDTSRKLVIAWILVTALCAVLRKRELWWAWFVASTATLLGYRSQFSRAEGPVVHSSVRDWRCC